MFFSNSVLLILNWILMCLCMMQFFANLLVLLVWIKNRKLRMNDNMLLIISLATVDFLYAILEMTHLVVLIDGAPEDDAIPDYDPASIIYSSVTSVGLMKSGCTIITAIAVDRVMALYRPMYYFAQNKRKWSLFWLTLAVCLAGLDCLLCIILVPIERHPGAFNFGGFINQSFRVWWGLSNITFNLLFYVLTFVLIYHFLRRSHKLTVLANLEKGHRTKVDRHASRVTFHILVVSVIIIIVPSLLNAIGPFTAIPMMAEIGTSVGFAAVISRLARALITLSHRDIQDEIARSCCHCWPSLQSTLTVRHLSPTPEQNSQVKPNPAPQHRPPNKMGTIYRSEFMSLCQIFLQTDAAYQCVSELGEAGVAMFRDLNEELNSYQRKFVTEVKRCDEMERKLRFIEEEVTKDDVEIPDVYEHIASPQPKDMVDLEATFEKIEEELVGINQNTKTLRDNHIQLWEMAQVIEKVQVLLDKGHTREHASTIISEQVHGVAIEDGYEKDRGYSDLKFLTGVIKRDKVLSFEKFLWRMCRGNVFLRSMDCDSETDEFGKVDGDKSVFILFFSGDQLQSRVDKICSGFHARIYNCPEDAHVRHQLHGKIQAQLLDLHNVIMRTLDHRARVVNAAAGSLSTWKIKVLKVKMIFHTLNMFSIDVTQKCLIAECWVPTDRIDEVRIALRNGTIAAGSMVHPVLNELETHDTPPTYFKHNKFTIGFQNIVDSYGVPSYREINPAPWTIISFPFLFGVMFGDSGHGVIMFLTALIFVLLEKRIIAAKIRDEIFNIFFGGRYIVLLMSLFSIYTGLIYNDIYSKSINIFGSSWLQTNACWNSSSLFNVSGTEFEAVTRDQKIVIDVDPIYCFDKEMGPYPFGVDPIWNIAANKLNFLNPMKMKMSVIIGILQMVFGVMLSFVNYIHRRSVIDFFFMFIPQMLFLCLIFVYLCVQIFAKWIFFSATEGYVFGQWYPGSNCAPSLLIGLINMFMSPERIQGFGEFEKVNGTDVFKVHEQCALQAWYPYQDKVEMVFVIVAIISIPVMLFVKPCYINCRHKRGLSIDEYVHNEGSNDEYSFGDIMVYQAIHVIEYVLGCISHTASYLRLWALSLAHAQLSDVLWTMLWNIGVVIPGYVGVVGMFILFIVFAFLSVAILILMEGLSAFLHTLRLHWVEFQSKFYLGQGIAFEPFYFTKLIRIAEGLEQ